MKSPIFSTQGESGGDGAGQFPNAHCDEAGGRHTDERNSSKHNEGETAIRDRPFVEWLQVIQRGENLVGADVE